MLIILHGEDIFRSRQKLKKLESAYRQKHEGGFSYDKLYADEITFGEFKNAARGVSLFDAHKFVVLENLSTNASLKKEIREWDGLQDIAKNDDAFVVFYEHISVKKDKVYKDILKIASKKQEFEKLPSVEAAKWFMGEFSHRGIKISRPVIKKVFELCGRDMYAAYNELMKLYTYKGGGDIKEEDLKIMSVGNMEAQIFPTIDAIFEGNKDKAIYNLLLHWSEGAAPEYIFYMIERQLKITAQVIDEKEKKTPSGSIAKKIGQHPFVVKKTLRLTDRFSTAKIKSLYARVESLDIKAKTGQLDPYLSCELLSVAVAS